MFRKGELMHYIMIALLFSFAVYQDWKITRLEDDKNDMIKAFQRERAEIARSYERR